MNLPCHAPCENRAANRRHHLLAQDSSPHAERIPAAALMAFQDLPSPPANHTATGCGRTEWAWELVRLFPNHRRCCERAQNLTTSLVIRLSTGGCER